MGSNRERSKEKNRDPISKVAAIGGKDSMSSEPPKHTECIVDRRDRNIKPLGLSIAVGLSLGGATSFSTRVQQELGFLLLLKVM